MSQSFHRWLQRREYGLPPNIGDRDFIMKRIYRSIDPYHHWSDLSDKPNSVSKYGAVFNLEFSPEGNVLVAACEKKTILLFDAITTNQTSKITDAHTDNVNCIKFLDDRMFATCSDDTTVALWDLRYLKMKVRSLHGHSNWVKNIEYSHKDNLLVTSGFDGSIFTWDINSQTEQGLIYQKVFHTSGLMRCRITPDGSKLVICTTGGYLMIIHNLDLTTLHKDLCGFRPTIYRLMQMGHQYIPQAAKYDHVFSKKQKKNRVELVTDFPEANDAEVILALQIHPQGHSFLSRNISFDEQTEWSCVHDITEEPGDITERAKEPSAKRKRRYIRDNDEDEPTTREANEEESGDSTDDVLFSVNRRQRRQRGIGPGYLIGPGANPPPPPPPTSGGSSNAAAGNPPPTSRQESFVPDIWAAEVTVQERAIRQNRARSSNSVTGYNFVYAISSGVLPAAATTRTQNVLSNSTSSTNRRTNASTNRSAETDIRLRTGSPPNLISTDGYSTSSSNSPPHLPFEHIRVRSLISPLIRFNKEHQIFQNPKKLMYYVQESNKGKGFIKEPCFSADGRIICSPHDTGVRLLGFTPDCSEYPSRHTLVDGKRNTKPLVQVKNITSHLDIVLSTKFSPREPTLVTGCRSGKVVWYHPNL